MWDLYKIHFTSRLIDAKLRRAGVISGRQFIINHFLPPEFSLFDRSEMEVVMRPHMLLVDYGMGGPQMRLHLPWPLPMLSYWATQSGLHSLCAFITNLVDVCRMDQYPDKDAWRYLGGMIDTSGVAGVADPADVAIMFYYYATHHHETSR